MPEPRELRATDLIGIEPNGSVNSHTINGIYETGMIIPAIDGKRYFYGTAGSEAIYIQVGISAAKLKKLGSIYAQEIPSFSWDTGPGGVASGVIQRTGATKAVIKNFLDIYLGVLSCAGGPVAWSITGMNLLVAGGKVKQNYAVYRDALEALVDNKLYFRTNMKIFYETILGELFFGRMEEELMGRAKDYLSEAMPGPKVAGKLVGVALAQIGENHLHQRLGTVKKMIENVLLKVADHVISKNEQIGEEQVKALAVHHLKPLLDETGVVINGPMSRAEAIIRETSKNAKFARPRLKKISTAIGALAS